MGRASAPEWKRWNSRQHFCELLPERNLRRRPALLFQPRQEVFDSLMMFDRRLLDRDTDRRGVDSRSDQPTMFGVSRSWWDHWNGKLPRLQHEEVRQEENSACKQGTCALTARSGWDVGRPGRTIPDSCSLQPPAGWDLARARESDLGDFHSLHDCCSRWALCRKRN